MSRRDLRRLDLTLRGADIIWAFAEGLEACLLRLSLRRRGLIVLNLLFFD